MRNLFQKHNRILGFNTRDWAILVGGLAVFTVLSLWTITKSSVWFDEAFGTYLIRFDFWQVAHYTAADVHPPLYYWLLQGWSLLFGTGELALRSMSVVFGAVAIFFGFLLTHRLFGRKAAWLSLVFMVLAPMFIRYSQEMRMYTLVSAIVLAATYVLTVAMETKKRSLWIMYGVLLALGMWTHYYAAIVWIAHWIWRAWTIKRAEKKKKRLRSFFSKEWLLAHAVAIGVFLPWLPLFVKQILIVQVGGFWIPPITPSTATNFFTNVLYYQDQDTVSPWFTLLFLIILGLMITLALRLYRTLADKQKVAYMLVITLAFVPMALLILLSMPPLRPTFIDRYLVASTLGIALFFGVTLTLSRLRPRIKLAFAAALVAVMIFGISNVYALGNYNKNAHNANNVRQLVRAVEAKAESGQPIIGESPWIFYEAVFYESQAHSVWYIDANTQYIYGSLDMLKYGDRDKIKDLSAFGKEHPVVWYIGRPDGKDMTPPDTSWVKLQQVEINDSVSGKPAYKAIQYRTH